jgi:hypothetical protein
LDLSGWNQIEPFELLADRWRFREPTCIVAIDRIPKDSGSQHAFDASLHAFGIALGNFADIEHPSFAILIEVQDPPVA